jgi:broad specificity phosphatase PhoE
VDAARPGFIRGRGHDSPTTQATNDDRLADQPRVSTPFHLDEERVHVNVKETLGEIGHAHTLPRSCDTRSMQIHLVRHGEVDNPRDVVYADIPGFGLSKLGRAQAAAAGDYLANRTVRRIVTSPLDRAIETATLIGAGAELVTERRLTEWGLAMRWRGALWPKLPLTFPGELEAYLADPFDLPFSPESLHQVVDRLTTAIDDWVDGSTGDVVFVSHEDPLHATHMNLTGSTADVFHRDKPTHCSVTTLEHGDGTWVTVSRWAPGG